MKDIIKDKISSALGIGSNKQEVQEEVFVINDIPDTTCIDYLKGLITPTVSDISDFELKKEVKKLAEEIKYSDPVSNKLVESTEKKLMDMATELLKMIYESDTENAKSKCNDIRIALRMRNSMMKQGK